MKHVELLKKAIKLQKELDKLGLEVYVNVGHVETCGSFISMGNSNLTKSMYGIDGDETIANLVELAKKMMEPKYIKLKGVCVDNIGSTVYIKENKTYKPLELVGMTKDGVMLSDGSAYGFDDVYVEE